MPSPSDPHPSEWDAQTYHRVSVPQFAWGRAVLSLLDLEGSETVLDAGCGSGRLTAEICKRLPTGKVIALDASQNMLDEARGTLGALYGDRVTYLKADLREVTLIGVADVIFSTATFHWILDHDVLFGNLYRALRPGGRLLAQCGGGPNLRRLHQRAEVLMAAAPFAPYFADWTNPWNFSDPGTSAERLTRAGFQKVRTSLQEALVPFWDAKEYGEFIGSVVLRAHLAKLPDETLRKQYVDALVGEAAADNPPYSLDYWRLNLEGRKPGSPGSS